MEKEKEKNSQASANNFIDKKNKNRKKTQK